MKRILYNNYTKFIAFILCALSVAASSYMVTTSFFWEDGIYLFERSYEESNKAGYDVHEEFYAIVNMIENTAHKDGKAHIDKLTNMPSPDEWEVYIKAGNSTYTNTEKQSYADFQNSSVSVGVKMTKDKNGAENREGFQKPPRYGYYFPDIEDDYEICVKMSQKAIDNNTVQWLEAKERADSAASKVIALLAFAAALFIYLLCATGRKYGETEIQPMLIDKMFVEITAVLFLGILIGGGILTALGAYYFIVEEGLYIANQLSAAAMFIVVSLSLLCLLSLVRNLKNGTFIKRSLIAKSWGFVWRTLKRILAWAWNAVKKILRVIRKALSEAKRSILTVSDNHFDGRFVGIMIVGFSIIIFLMTVMVLSVPMFVVFLMAFVIAAVVFVNKRLMGFNSLKKGIEKIKNGDLNHKITDCPDGVIGSMAQNVNSIGDGLQKSLEREIKAERMKSELITNVSHDLKTPLTSIINYADLLENEDLTPPEANDYVKIIKQKSERLKQLTSDLFDISKAQSGNEEFNMEDIDLCLLVSQALAELNAQIEKSGLVFKVTSEEKEIFARADGKKMSRVFENLLTNCVKYAMKNTRVYIDIAKTDTGAAVEIKNIAGYEMDFDETEITERFVRGDSARSSEGSGLGLAIVKSYVEGCGGTVVVKKDGDLFKVILNLK